MAQRSQDVGTELKDFRNKSNTFFVESMSVLTSFKAVPRDIAALQMVTLQSTCTQEELARTTNAELETRSKNSNALLQQHKANTAIFGTVKNQLVKSGFALTTIANGMRLIFAIIQGFSQDAIAKIAANG